MKKNRKKEKREERREIERREGERRERETEREEREIYFSVRYRYSSVGLKLWSEPLGLSRFKSNGGLSQKVISDF